MYVAHAADPVMARREMAACNERFLSGLGVKPGPSATTTPAPAGSSTGDPPGHRPLR
jgi:hypothetical protein